MKALSSYATKLLSAVVIATLALAALPVQPAHALTDTYTTAGTFAWVAPAGVTSVTVEVWGGGGRGSNASSSSPFGGGGGGGGYSESVITVTPGTTYTVTVGAGSSSSGVAGGRSSFIDELTVMANGGLSPTTSTGAAGGALGVGTVTFSGGQGANGTSGASGGGGGSSAGTASNGEYSVVTTSSAGATAPAGGGNGGDGRSGSSGAGSAGSGPGGGGGGAFRTSGNQNGGSGAAGKVALTYTAAPTTTVGNGTNPASKTVSGSATNKAVDAFNLSTNNTPETVTDLQITGGGTGVADVAINGVKLWQDNGSTPNEWDATDTQIGSGLSFSGSTATFSGLSLTVTTTPVQYLITYDIIASPTNGDTLTCLVSDFAFASSNAKFINDTTSATLTIDAVAPTVTNVTSTAANGTYGVGASIPVTVTLSEPETVVGTPQLTLETGATDRVVNYTSGSGTSTMIFTYVVQPGDASPDLDYESTTALALNGGTVRDAAGNDATLTLPSPGTAGSLGDNKAIVIETTGRTITASAGPGGTISPSGAIAVANTGSQAFDLAPNAGFIVADVLVDGVSQGRINGYTFTNVLADHTISATFESGWTAPTQNSDVSGGTAGSFSNAGSAYASDNAYAAVSAPLLGSARASYYGYGFAIPSDAIINGIQVSLEGNRPSGSRTFAVDLTWNNSTFSTAQTQTAFTAADSTVIVGSAVTTTGWGAHVWTPADLNSDNFRVRVTVSSGFNQTINLDELQVKVNYNAPPNAPSAINQYKTDATTVLAEGGHTNETQVVFKATTTDPEADQYKLEVEAVPTADPFANTATCSSPLVNSGTEASTGLCGAFTDGTAYKWQYRLVDNASPSNATAWTPFGGSDPDFSVDTTLPTVTNIDSTEASGTYGIGALLHINVTFSEAVNVGGVPQLTLETGGTDEAVNYASGSGTSTLTFNYTVLAGDVSPDLDYLSNTALALNGGSIQDAALNNATLTLPDPGTAGSLGANKDIVINTSSASVSGVSSTSANGAYTTGAVIPITITFSTAVDVTGTPQLTLETGTTDEVVGYSSGTGTNTLTFNYTVVSGDTSTDLDYVSVNALALNGGTIQSGGVDAILTLSVPGTPGSLGANKAIVIDTTAPSTTSFTLLTPGTSPTNADSLTFRATFSEPVSGVDTADFASNSTSTATVSGVSLVTSSTYDVTISGGDLATFNGTVNLNLAATPTITDPAGNAVPAVEPGTDQTYTVDNLAPTVTGVSATEADGTYGVGALIHVNVSFSEAVVRTGFPQLTLETGAVDQVLGNSGGTGTSTLTFNYTVAAADASSDLDYVSTTALALNGGTIRDPAGNDATLTLPDPGATGSLGANKNIVINHLTVGDGTAPANKSVQPLDTNKAVSVFTLVTNIASGTVTDLVITGTNTANVVNPNGVKLYADINNDHEWDAGDSLIASTSFSGSTATFTGLSLGVTTTPAQYVITYDIVGSPTNGQTMTASVTGATAAPLPVTDNDNVDATLTIAVLHTITASAGAGGTITPSGAVSVTEGTSPVFKIQPSTGNIVASVSVDGGASLGRLNSYTFPAVAADHTIAATFESGWTGPTLTSNPSGGFTALTSPNAFTSDDLYAVGSGSGDGARYYGFGFVIPGGAIINGIQVSLEGNRTSGRTFSVDLSWNAGTNFSTAVAQSASTIPTFGSADSTTIYGSSANTTGWGAHVWAATELSDANFRVRVTSSGGGGNIDLDQLQVKVYYTPTYTLTYTADANGSISGASPQIVPSGGSGTAVTAVPNTGYHFVSWSDGGLTASRTDTNVTADLSVTATFAINTYTVTFDSNGGTGSMSDQSADYNVATPLTTNTFTRTGYTFSGWNTLANGSGTAYADGASYPFTESATLYAQWAVNPITVSFDNNGGSGSMSDQTANYNVATPLTANTFTRTNYTFSGWNTLANGSGTAYADGASYPFTESATLYAQWAVNPITVSFDNNGGSGSMSDQTADYNVATPLTTNTFTRTGYTFSGWNTLANGSGTPYADGALYPFAQDATLYAQWTINSYTVTFNNNGGSGSMSDQTAVYNVATPLTTNTFTRTGYTFSGWNTLANGSGTAYADGASYPFTADATLYAQWTVNTVTVSFNNNGGSGVMSDQTANYNVATPLTSNTFTRTGYTFSGWNTLANGSGTPYADGASYPFTADATLYAQWTINTYTVIFDNNGGSGSMSNQTANYNVATPLTSNTFTRTGYTFSGWNTLANGSGTPYADGASYPFTADATLYAQWTINTYTVIFDNNGGSGSMSNQTANYNVATPLTSNTFTRTGYTFSGWNTLANGLGTTYTDGASYPFTSSATLYAQWTINSYTVSFNNNGGSGVMSDQTANYNVATPLTANTFTKTGYTFSSWNTLANGLGTTYTDGASYPFTASATLYAQWTINTYTVSFNNNGGSGVMSDQTANYNVATPLTSNTFTKTGYTFSSWNTLANGLGTTYTDGASYPFTASATLYAQWTINSYTVSFNNNGGSGVMSDQTANYNVATPLTANTFTKTGYTFSSWNTLANGLGTTYTDGASYPFTASATLYAQWTINSYTVSFNNNGGSGVMSDQTANYNVATPLTSNTFTRTGYTFSGWNTLANGLGTAYANGASYPFTADATLYAQWTITTVTVTFDNNGGSGSMTNQSANYGVATPLNTNTFTRTGYIFTGWNTAANGSGTAYANGASYPFTASATLYAQWTSNTVTVTFNSNGGSGSMSNQTANYGVATALTSNTFTRTGYTFSGWNTAANGTGTAYANGASYPFTASATLYAQWTATTVTVTFNSNGGSGSMSNQTANYGVATALTTNTFTRTGYTFSGWNTAANGSGTAYANGASYPFTASVTLYAQWSTNHTLTYSAGPGGSISGTSPQTVNNLGSGTPVTAVANPGYHFVKWSDGSTTNPRKDTNVTADISVTATFAINGHTLTYTAGTGGIISGTSPQTVTNLGSGSPVTAVPNSGYHFVNWSDASIANPRTDTAVTADISVTANFAADTVSAFTLTYTAGPHGAVSGPSPQRVSYNGRGSAVTALPDSGYYFAGWSDASTANPRTDAAVTGNISVTARFVANGSSAPTPPGVPGGGVNTVPPTTDNILSEGETVPFGITQFTIHFTQAVYDPAGNSDPNDVTNPHNYMLVRANASGFQTVSCSGGVLPDDTAITVNSVSYNNGTFTATLSVNGGVPLPAGTYRLFACGTTSIVDALDTTLKLAGNGAVSGTDFIRNFTVSAGGTDFQCPKDTESQDRHFNCHWHRDNWRGYADDHFQCKMDGGPWARCTDGQDFGLLANGSHSFQLQAVDSAGALDTPPLSYDWDINAPLPTIQGAGVPAAPATGAKTGPGVTLAEGQVVSASSAQFFAQFDQNVYDPAGDSDVNDVTNPANYLLVRDDGDGFQTTSCREGAQPGDTAISIDAVTYDNAKYIATLSLNSALPLSNGIYRLFVCGTTSIVDAVDHVKLAGDGTNAGTDFIRDFIVSDAAGGGGGTIEKTGKDQQAAVKSGVLPTTGFAPGGVTVPGPGSSQVYAAANGVQVEIPVLSVKAPIVGVARQGNDWQDLSGLGRNAGYLEGSAYPTWPGNTVLTGHVVDASGVPGIFSNIKDLQIGDKVYIHAGGKIFVYEVRENHLVFPSAVETVFQHETYNWVTLVTCENWNGARRAYTYRRMVRAVLISVIPEK